jgi:hypothetical protein
VSNPGDAGPAGDAKRRFDRFVDQRLATGLSAVEPNSIALRAPEVTHDRGHVISTPGPPATLRVHHDDPAFSRFL